MRRFQKLLKIELQVAKHAFRNMDLKSRKEAIHGYDAEGVTRSLKKKLKNDNRGQRNFACK